MKSPAKQAFFGVAFRLAVAFAAVLALFATALLVTLRTLEELARAEREVSGLDESKHAGHIVAGLVREEYIHQAHTIIEWNRTHLDHYDVAARHAREAAKRLLTMPLTSTERAQAREVSDLAVLIDREFHDRIVPAIDAGDRERVHAEHARIESLVNRVVAINERLNRSLEQRAAIAHDREASLRQRALVIVVGCFVLAIVVTAGAWFAISQALVKRLAQLRQGALELASGNLAARVSLQGTDELSELGATFNDMATSLENHQQELIQSSRLALLGQVAAGVAHEINNPLAVILGYAKVLREKQSEAPEVTEPLRIIEDEARQCQRIVQALLELGRPTPSSTALVSMTDIARDAADRLREAGTLGNRNVQLPSDSATPLVRGDAAALRQVVSNLLLNAVEATTDSGAIAIRVVQEGEFLVLEVEDHGGGIAPDVLPRVLEPFFTTKTTGTGLGLAICQAIANAHDGTLELESEVGTRTRARLRLPRSRQHKESAA